MHRLHIRNIMVSGMMLALAIVLPIFTGSIPVLGQAFLPMHLPIIICGFICGPKYGGLVGFVAPLLRTLLFALPPLYPVAVAMSFELLTYGLISGFMYQSLKHYNLLGIYATLFTTMLAGRLIFGLVNTILLGLQSTPYSFKVFVSAAFLSGIPGIILQLILIPMIVFATNQVSKRRGPLWS